MGIWTNQYMAARFESRKINKIKGENQSLEQRPQQMNETEEARSRWWEQLCGPTFIQKQKQFKIDMYFLISFRHPFDVFGRYFFLSHFCLLFFILFGLVSFLVVSQLRKFVCTLVYNTD